MRYEEFYGYRLDGIPVELVRLSVVAHGEAPTFATFPGVPDGAAADRAPRLVSFPGPGFIETSIVDREALGAGDTLQGPAVVEFVDSTAVVPPGWTLTVQATGILEVVKT